MERVQLPRICLDTLRMTSPLLATGVMPDQCYTLIYVTECPQEGHSFNFSARHRAGYIGFFPPGGALDAFVPAGYENATLTIPKNVLLDELAKRFPEVPTAWLEHGVGLAVPEPSRSRIRALLKARKEIEEADSGWLANPMARQGFEDDLIDVFTEGLRDAWSRSQAVVNPGRFKRYGTMCRIRDHIAAELKSPIRVEDLCAISGMSRRGLEYVFKDCLGISVNSFVRSQRLHGVRRELLAADFVSAQVKKIALDWGFWHLGRFAAQYRQMFGENPLDTLRRKPKP